MNWQAAIDLNRNALLRIIASLVAMTTVSLSRHSRNAVLRLLRPAESAARRLIVIAAKIYGKEPRKVERVSHNKLPDFATFKRGIKNPSFKLIDPRKRFDWLDEQASKQAPKFMPRISVIGVSNPVFNPPKQAHRYSTQHLIQRLNTLQEALDNLPKQAKRLNRQMQKRKAAPAGPKRVPPLRPGLPPSNRAKPTHEVDLVLKECHALALYALEPPS